MPSADAPEPNADSQKRFVVLRRIARAAVWASPLFAIPIVAILLAGPRWIRSDAGLMFRGGLIFCVVLLWLIAAALLAAAVHRRRFTAALRGNRTRLVGVAISTLAAFAVAEVALRLSGHPSATPAFRLVPSTRFHHVNPKTSEAMHRQVSVRTNGDGFRSSYSREEFLRHRVRIACLGDSFLFGVGVEQDRVVPAVLERELRERFDTEDIAVLNTGVISYSPLLEREVFREVVREYRPTLTLLLLDGNDIGDDYKYADLAVPTDSDRLEFDVPGDSGESSLALLRFAKPLLTELVNRSPALRRSFSAARKRNDYYEFRVRIGDAVETNRWFILRHPLELTRPHFDRTFGYVTDIAGDAAAIGSEFVLLLPPRYFHWSDRECPENWAGHRYDYDEPHEFAYFEYFDSVADQAPFKIRSLLPEFLSTDEFPLMFREDPHWNEAGHAFVGRAIADYLVSAKLVAPR